MTLEGKKIGLGITGSFCNFSKVPEIINSIQKAGAEVIPILSSRVQIYDTRFNNATEFQENIKELTKNEPVLTIVDAEPIGPKNMIDLMLIAPCTGNTVAKLTYSIIDDTILMATKSHLRNNKPVVLGISTNDALGLSAKNIGTLLATKNIYFVPFGQDAPEAKPNSLTFAVEKIVPTIELALEGKQIQPILN